MRYFKIGDISKLLGLTTQAIRFYEQEGVIHPQKSENGTRYYSFDELHKMLSFKKYRMADFSVQDFVNHLKADTFDDLSEKLDDKSDELIAKSEEFLRRAHALQQFRREISDAQRKIDTFEECMRPELLMQSYAINDFPELRSFERAEIREYIDALPATSIALVYPVAMKTPARLVMCVSPERAKLWSLSTRHTEKLSSVPCVRIPILFPGSYQVDTPVRASVERMQNANYRLNPNEDILCLHIASGWMEGVFKLCSMLYIPIFPKD